MSALPELPAAWVDAIRPAASTAGGIEALEPCLSMLLAAGWSEHHIDNNGNAHITRPNKHPKGGASATVWKQPDHHVTIWSTAVDGARTGTPYYVKELAAFLKVSVPPQPESEREFDVVTTMSDVVPEDVSWLWPGRIPFGKLTVVEGDPKTGKSTMTIDLMARVVTGSAMPDGSESDLDAPADCILMTAEDGLADTVRPRLDAAGADARRVHSWDGVASTTPDGKTEVRLPSLPLDVGRLEAMVIRHSAKLVIIDVLAAYLGEKVDSHRDSDVRRALAPLAKMAERTGAAVVVLRHLNKGTGTKAVYRGGGSIGISGQARSILLVALDPNDETMQRQVLAVTACNLAATAPSLSFELASDGPVAPVRIEWTGTSTLSADELLADPGSEDERSDRKEIAERLTAWTEDGPVAVEEVRRKLRDDGLAPSTTTLQRARRDAGVKVGSPAGFGGKRHYWRPATQSGHPSEGGQGDRTATPPPNRENDDGDGPVRSPIDVWSDWDSDSRSRCPRCDEILLAAFGSERLCRDCYSEVES